MLLKGILQGGKLHGLVQIYGILPLDLNGHCKKIDSKTNDLSFIGNYENGIPIGPCWRRLVGGAWFYGIVNENGEFTGSNDIAYIYPDLELTMVGQFKNSLLVIMNKINICKTHQVGNVLGLSPKCLGSSKWVNQVLVIKNSSKNV